jgi:hypothetical protein
MPDTEPKGDELECERCGKHVAAQDIQLVEDDVMQDVYLLCPPCCIERYGLM